MVTFDQFLRKEKTVPVGFLQNLEEQILGLQRVAEPRFIEEDDRGDEMPLLRRGIDKGRAIYLNNEAFM